MPSFLSELSSESDWCQKWEGLITKSLKGKGVVCKVLLQPAPAALAASTKNVFLNWKRTDIFPSAEILYRGKACGGLRSEMYIFHESITAIVITNDMQKKKRDSNLIFVGIILFVIDFLQNKMENEESCTISFAADIAHFSMFFILLWNSN